MCYTRGPLGSAKRRRAGGGEITAQPSKLRLLVISHMSARARWGRKIGREGKLVYYVVVVGCGEAVIRVGSKRARARSLSLSKRC